MGKYILKLKKVNFTAIEVTFFLWDVDIENVLVSKNSVQILKIGFDSEPVYNSLQKFLKFKTKSNDDEATNFRDKEILRACSEYILSAVISVHSALKIDAYCFPFPF